MTGARASVLQLVFARAPVVFKENTWIFKLTRARASDSTVIFCFGHGRRAGTKG